MTKTTKPLSNMAIKILVGEVCSMARTRDSVPVTLDIEHQRRVRLEQLKDQVRKAVLKDRKKYIPEISARIWDRQDGTVRVELLVREGCDMLATTLANSLLSPVDRKLFTQVRNRSAHVQHPLLKGDQLICTDETEVIVRKALDLIAGSILSGSNGIDLLAQIRTIMGVK